MLEQAFAVSGCVTVALVGLVASNLLHDRGVTNSLSRYVAPILGGVAFLVAVLWLDIWTATVLSCAMALFILAVRLGFRRGLRGVEGNLPTQAWAEVTYAMGGTASLAAGWGVLGDRWLAFLPIAFMAWRDSTAGLLRATIWRGNLASIWPSVAMLGVCLAAAAFYQPYWIGALGALVATAAERRRPMVLRVWDDNLHVVAASLAVMGALAAALRVVEGTLV